MSKKAEGMSNFKKGAQEAFYLVCGQNKLNFLPLCDERTGAQLFLGSGKTTPCAVQRGRTRLRDWGRSFEDSIVQVSKSLKWSNRQRFGRISVTRINVHHDVSPVMHVCLWVSGLMSWCTHFRRMKIRPFEEPTVSVSYVEEIAGAALSPRDVSVRLVAGSYRGNKTSGIFRSYHRHGRRLHAHHPLLVPQEISKDFDTEF